MYVSMQDESHGIIPLLRIGILTVGQKNINKKEKQLDPDSMLRIIRESCLDLGTHTFCVTPIGVSPCQPRA